MDRLKAIETFVIAAEAKSFSDAASRLRISRGLVGRRIAQLEDHLKLRLFNRTTRELSLTPEGRRYFNSCARIINLLLEEEEALSSLQSGTEGELKILAAGSFGRSQLLPALAEFRNLYPGLQIEVELSPVPPTAIQLVERGFDLGIRIYPPPANSRIIMKKICSFDWIVCASTDYLREKRLPQHPADFAEHSIVIARGHEQWNLARRGKAYTSEPEPSIRVSSSAMRPAVLAGLGIGFLPIYTIDEDILAGRIIPLLPGYSDPTGRVVAVYPQAKMSAAKVSLFTNFLAKRCAKKFEASGLSSLQPRGISANPRSAPRL
jgi:DNA-binding transcriptional LysR family regulator